MIEGANRFKEQKAYYFANKLAELDQMRESGIEVINLGIGSPDQAAPEIATSRLIESLTDSNAHKYQSYQGIPELREGIANFYTRFFEVTLNPNTDILPLIGSKEGIFHSSMAFLNPGDKVLIPNPGYPSYSTQTKMVGGEVLEYEIHTDPNNPIHLDELESLDLISVKMMWINFPHMPTGTKASDSFLKKLVAFAKKHDILLCHDNPYAFILNEDYQSILKYDPERTHCLELFSMSKSFNMAGWRVGSIQGHPEYIDKILKVKSNIDSGMFKPVQLAAAECLNNICSDWFSKLNQEYGERRQWVEKIYGALNVSYRQDQVGMFLWGQVPSHSGVFWSDKVLKETGVFMTPGFIFGNRGENHLRISLCSSQETFAKAYEKIKAIC